MLWGMSQVLPEASWDWTNQHAETKLYVIFTDISSLCIRVNVLAVVDTTKERFIIAWYAIKNYMFRPSGGHHQVLQV
jgi:hypothetical protein